VPTSVLIDECLAVDQSSCQIDDVRVEMLQNVSSNLDADSTLVARVLTRPVHCQAVAKLPKHLSLKIPNVKATGEVRTCLEFLTSQFFWGGYCVLSAEIQLVALLTFVLLRNNCLSRHVLPRELECVIAS